MTQKKIDYRFKILYAVGIFMVVSGHCEGGSISLLYNWFPSGGLHLALFAFCSGYFYKRTEEEQVWSFIKKKFKTLIIPMYLYNFAYAFLIVILSVKEFTIGGNVTLKKLFLEPILNGHQFEYNMGGWFVVPLFLVQVSYLLLRKGGRTCRAEIPEWVYFLFCQLLGILGMYMAWNVCEGEIWMPLLRTLYFLPFYSMGVFYKNTLEAYDRVPGIWYFSFIFLAKLIIVWIYGKMPAYTVSWFTDFMDGPVLPFVVGFLGIAFWLRIARILEPVIGRNPYVNLLADHTYSIMIHQFLGFMLVKTVFAAFSRLTVYCRDFDWESYKSDIYYCYLPEGIEHIKILYLTAGLVLPILIQKGIDRIKGKDLY